MLKEGRYYFTSESVGEGHPDKMCDQISDAVLDAILAKDSTARVACETYVTRGLVVIGGEITTKTWVDVDSIAREEIKRIGYTDPKYGFNYETCAILNVIGKQSPDISQGVDVGGAGDQGFMVGYAVNETKEYMPITIVLANEIVKNLAVCRKNGKLKFTGPDCKSQITFEYINGKPARIDTVVVSTQHTSDVLDKSGQFITEAAQKKIIDAAVMPVIKKWCDKNTKILINPTGKFVIGGPQSDTGMTGRKIIVDTYGGRCPHGGGAFSGKDPTKVDRSAAYMARYIAKNIVAAKLAEECTIQIAYAIGKAEPVGVYVYTHGTGKVSDEKLTLAAKKVFPLTPKGIIEHFKLRRPVYKQTAAFGHFGRAGFPWEKTDKTKALIDAVR
ncbi:Methionine adenosyltransferase [Elusimicrobium minutum Pei191]|uniref:S-adenosylmethionine synthase n=1 Tax=Elusimicrobium minutum (strain Pei191) TaxID=445932 RepID=B2KE50_ELUMP|nr:methionine adenosyltransferase [Elusimicrobium minutum]ACC98796.1 Methionine adenosyltransferase [Elusimicrobium minutum Pei191]